MPELGQSWLFEVKLSDCRFLRTVGIKPCLPDDPSPEPLPWPRERCLRPTEKDALWLKSCGVAWEPEQGSQLSMDFCRQQEAA